MDDMRTSLGRHDEATTIQDLRHMKKREMKVATDSRTALMRDHQEGRSCDAISVLPEKKDDVEETDEGNT